MAEYKGKDYDHAEYQHIRPHLRRYNGSDSSPSGGGSLLILAVLAFPLVVILTKVTTGWKYFFIGFFIAIGIEIITMINRSKEEDEDEHEAEPVSISNGTIFKTLVGVGILGWLFRRKK